MATLIPTIKWSQNDEYVIINLEINQVKNDVYEINNNNIVFTGVSNTDLNYSINLELLNTINKDESKYIVEERVIRFVLKKTEYEKWIRLTKDKNQYKSNIKVNWDSFEDSDEETQSETPSNQQFDFSNMMNMGNDNNGFNMEEMMKNMNPDEMEQLMKSMNMGGSDDNNDDENDDEENDEDYDDEDDDNNDDDNNDDDINDDDENDEDKELDDELNNIINNNDYEEESFDSDDLCQDCVNP